MNDLSLARRELRVAVVCAHRGDAGGPEPVQLGLIDCLGFDGLRWSVTDARGPGVLTVERAELWISCRSCRGSRSLSRRNCHELAAAQWARVVGTEHEGRAVAVLLLDEPRR